MREAFRKRVTPLLAVVCCPHSRTRLTYVPSDEVEGFVDGKEWSRRPAGTSGALVSVEAGKAYPILGEIVSFLEEDTLTALSGLRSRPESETARAAASETSMTKQAVKTWYDKYGWKRTASGAYGDTETFSQEGRTAHGFYEMDSHLQCLRHFMGGNFLLDAASGAIPHPEYFAYSWHYTYRVCVDISRTALEEASAKLGQRGFYIMADICRLPFRDDVFDGIISGYTIQHIPASDQQRAVSELHRVLRPGSNCCILTGLKPTGIARRVRRQTVRAIVRTPAPRIKRAAPAGGPAELYGHLQSVMWWGETLAELGATGSIQSLRLLNRDEFESLCGNSLRAAKALRQIEVLMPKRLARISRYGLIHFSKSKRE